MKIIEFFEAIARKLPDPLSWDNDGLAFCADKNKDVLRVLCALDVTLDTVEYAAKNNFDVILSHHPVLFNPIKSLTEDTVSGRRLIALAKHGIAAISFHTRLDLMKGGVNDVLFERLGLKNPEFFGEGGFYRVGEYEADLTPSEFANLVKSALNLPHVAYAASRNVKRVCIVGGGGNESEDIMTAVSAGADTYITGELKYHQLVDAADMGINLFEAGHYHTEYPAVAVLEDLARSVCPGIRTEIFDANRISID